MKQSERLSNLTGEEQVKLIDQIAENCVADIAGEYNVAPSLLKAVWTGGYIYAKTHSI